MDPSPNVASICRIASYDTFVQLFSYAPFAVVERTAQKRTRKHSSDDEENAPEPPMDQALRSTLDPCSGAQCVSLVGLRPNQSFRIKVLFQDPTDVPQEALRQQVLNVATTLTSKIVCARSLLTSSHMTELSPDDFVRAIVAHPTDWMITLVDWHQRRQVQQLLSRMYFEGLFTIPSSQHNCLISLPNGRQRYGIDLHAASTDCWTSSRKVRRALQMGGRVSDVSPRSLRVEVNRDFADSMRRAVAYHTRNEEGGTWITAELVKALELMTVIGSPHGVKLCAVELWDDNDTLLAGCLGFALGSVYHDFTMFTSVRSSASYGSLITKVLGAALQDCGYRLWYWGFRVAYMDAYEVSCGAKAWDRGAFYDLWTQYRSELPIWSIDVYLNDGMGLVPSRKPNAKEATAPLASS